MDSTALATRIDATAIVARDFEPVRIERQLLAHAFDLACEIANRSSEGPSKSSANLELPDNTDSVNVVMNENVEQLIFCKACSNATVVDMPTTVRRSVAVRRKARRYATHITDALAPTRTALVESESVKTNKFAPINLNEPCGKTLVNCSAIQRCFAKNTNADCLRRKVLRVSNR